MIKILPCCPPPPPLSPHTYRYITQSLPLLFAGAVLLLLLGVKALQWVQARVFHVVPFWSMGSVTIGNVCTSILLGGMFMLYFGAWVPGAHCHRLPRLLLSCHTCAEVDTWCYPQQ